MRPRRVTDEQIDQVAAAAFIQHGPAASLGSIAASLGITQPGLLHRVGCKEALLVRALCPGIPHAIKLLQAGPQPGGLIDQLEPALTGLLHFLNDALPSLSVLRFAGVDISQILPSGPPPPQLARQAVADWIMRCGDRVVSCQSPEIVADLLVGSLEARAMNRHLSGRPRSGDDDSAYVRGLVTALIREKSS